MVFVSWTEGKCRPPRTLFHISDHGRGSNGSDGRRCRLETALQYTPDERREVLSVSFTILIISVPIHHVTSIRAVGRSCCLVALGGLSLTASALFRLFSFSTSLSIHSIPSPSHFPSFPYSPTPSPSLLLHLPFLRSHLTTFISFCNDFLGPSFAPIYNDPIHLSQDAPLDSPLLFARSLSLYDLPSLTP